MRLWLVGAVMAAAVAAVVTWPSLNSTSWSWVTSPTANAKHNGAKVALTGSQGAVRVWQWAGSSTAAQVRRAGLPAIIIGHPSTVEWPCRHWSPASLAKLLHRVPVKRQRSSNVFIYTNDGVPMATAPESFFDRNPHLSKPPLIDMKAEVADEFLQELLLSQPGSSHAYVGCPLSQVLPPETLQAQLGPESRDFFPDQPAIEVNLWIGTKGVEAHPHYDTSENFYLPLFGKKTFVVAPPSVHKAVRLYPSLHWHYRQTQVSNLNDTGQALVIELQAGQVLYLPPFWFHHVKSPVRQTTRRERGAVNLHQFLERIAGVQHHGAGIHVARSA
eukprot:m.275650 g.275650  ORF g.275650 m.275650 type:complete len:330 (-) comp19356_c1_seq9:3938-4927(-)